MHSKHHLKNSEGQIQVSIKATLSIEKGQKFDDQLSSKLPQNEAPQSMSSIANTASRILYPYPSHIGHYSIW
jgi:hypothetical protein